MNRKQKFLTFAAAAAVACIVAVWWLSAKPAKASLEEDRPRVAAVVMVKKRPIVNSMTLSGAFTPYQQVDVHAKVAGYIQKIFVDVGDHVKAGQVLAILEVPELSAQVAGARADIHRYQEAITRSQSEIRRTESSHAAYHAAYTRLKQASESRPGLIAEQELDDAMARDQESEAQIESAKAGSAESKSQLLAAQADLDRLSALEAYSHITAPFSGVVTKRYADTGALIQAGTASDTQSMPVVQLVEWTRLRLVVPVPESAVPQLKLGNTVQVRVPAMNRDFEGKVARFADALNEETRTMHTEIDVENPSGALKDGMYAEVKLVLERAPNVLTLPIQAIERTSSGGTVLAVNAEGRLQERKVQLGVEGTNLVQVVSGLAENDRVFIGNRSDFRAGEKIEPKLVDEKAEAEASL